MSLHARVAAHVCLRPERALLQSALSSVSSVSCFWGGSHLGCVTLHSLPTSLLRSGGAVCGFRLVLVNYQTQNPTHAIWFIKSRFPETQVSQFPQFMVYTSSLCGLGLVLGFECRRYFHSHRIKLGLLNELIKSEFFLHDLYKFVLV